MRVEGLLKLARRDVSCCGVIGVGSVVVASSLALLAILSGMPSVVAPREKMRRAAIGARVRIARTGELILLLTVERGGMSTSEADDVVGEEGDIDDSPLGVPRSIFWVAKAPATELNLLALFAQRHNRRISETRA